MGIVASLMQADLIDLACEWVVQDQFFTHKAEDLLTKGYVTEDFARALSQREAEYPTGLALEHVTLAIPHTYAEYVKRPFLYLNRLMRPEIPFVQMGTDDQLVYPHYVLILGIAEAKAQVTLLAELMELFTQETFIQALDEAKDPEAVLRLFSH